MTSLLSPPAAASGSETEVVGRRIGAALVDAVFVFAVFYAGVRLVAGQSVLAAPAIVAGFLFWFVFSVLGFTPLLALHGFSIAPFLGAAGIWAVYGAVFEATLARTPGKRLFGLVVVGADGRRLSPTRALVRNLFRLVDSILFYGVGFAVLSLTERRQRLGDLAGGTLVQRAAPANAADEDDRPEESLQAY